MNSCGNARIEKDPDPKNNFTYVCCNLTNKNCVCSHWSVFGGGTEMDAYCKHCPGYKGVE